MYTGPGESLRVRIRSLDGSGDVRALPHPPQSWVATDALPTVVGSGPEGVLVGMEGSDGSAIWRLAGGLLTRTAFENNSDLLLPTRGGMYSPTGGLLMRDLTTDADDAEGEGAAVVDLNGRDVRHIWP